MQRRFRRRAACRCRACGCPRHFSVVVLPAPLGPSSQTYLAAGHLEGDAIDGGETAVALVKPRTAIADFRGIVRLVIIGLIGVERRRVGRIGELCAGALMTPFSLSDPSRRRWRRIRIRVRCQLPSLRGRRAATEINVALRNARHHHQRTQSLRRRPFLP